MESGFGRWGGFFGGLLLLAAGCSSDGDGQTSGDGDGDDGALSSTTTECGELTCSQSETCLQIQTAAPFSSGPTSYECVPTPAGCGGIELCDCQAGRGEVQGKPVTGCSLLGERTLYVSDVTCGDRNCTSSEYCLVEHSGMNAFSDVIGARCEPLEGACADDLCGPACRESVIASTQQTYLGCFEAEWARAISVATEP